MGYCMLNLFIQIDWLFYRNFSGETPLALGRIVGDCDLIFKYALFGFLD